MKKIKSLNYKLLRRKTNPSELSFQAFENLKPLNGFLGQNRAHEALDFGIGIKSKGYNMYAMGPSGIGKYSLITMVLQAQAHKMPTSSDWCYIYNFDDPEKPLPLEFKSGEGYLFQQDMAYFLEELSAIIVTVFESHDFHRDLKKIYASISKFKKNKHEKRTLAQLGKIKYQKEKEFVLHSFSAVVTPIINRFINKYQEREAIINYLTAMQKDILDHINDFIKSDEKTNAITFSWENPALTKYKVNLFVDNRNTTGGPVIFEETPSYSTLFCRIEHTGQHGAPATNFTLLRSGALLRANGGYLIIEARKIIKNKDVWDALKNALHMGMIKIKPNENDPDAIKPVSLEPLPIPLNVKIILLGDRNSYYSLCQSDPDFTELFKVAIDFDEQVDRNKKNINLYARLIKTIVDREHLRTLSNKAIGEIIEYGSELAEDSEKLSTHIRDIEDLIFEANYWASTNNKNKIDHTHVKRALAAKTHRMDRSRELYYEDINRDFIIIKTKGSAIGQVNCLSVRRVGNFSYGHPTRVTARVGVGAGKLIDIQREIKLAGPMHSKAGFIISSFLASRFNENHLYSLSARISFEQIYCWTDGDSASVGELCALLSALAEAPINQSLAITGSIDQYGTVQTVGGVNEKIMGFFDVCQQTGLTGKQGVIIPAANQKNLMLREDIVNAVKKEKFAIYAIEDIDQAISLLTGLPTGSRKKAGSFETGSLYDVIGKRLQLFNKNRK
ncbi:MAG: ATP-binding protein [Gammaproteobacteria bacterium]